MRITRTRTMVVVSFAGLFIALCTLGARALNSDPIMGFEIVAGVVVAVWAARLTLNVWRTRGLSATLRRQSRPADIDGVECRLLAGVEPCAFVVGIFRPTIYVGERLIEVLEPEERRAVLLHEEHHRRTRAPLRGASLDAWLTIMRPMHRMRIAIVDRSADLERGADAFAMANGVRPATLASALLKVDTAGAVGLAAFSQAADRRIASLLQVSAGAGGSHVDRLPYEWLPPVVFALVAITCHVIGATPA